MNKTDLKSYLEMVLDLEIQRSVCERILSEVQSVRYDFKPIQLIPYEKNYTSSQIDYSVSWKQYSAIKGKYDNYSVYGAIIGGVIGFSMVRALTPLALIVFPIIGNIIGKKLAKNKEQREEAAMKNSVEVAKKRKVEDLNQQVKKRNAEIMVKNTTIQQTNEQNQNKVRMQNKLISDSIDKLLKICKEANSALQNAYSLEIIYPKYQNLTAIAAIYEYIASGICTQLEGHGGAYDTFERDSKMDAIASHLYDITGKLKTVISNQGAMIKNQREMIANQDRMINNQKSMIEAQASANDNQIKLYESVNNMNSTMTTISNEIKENTEKLNEIGINTALTAYTTQVIERNQYYERNWRNMKGYYEHI